MQKIRLKFTFFIINVTVLNDIECLAWYLLCVQSVHLLCGNTVINNR